MWNRLTKNYFRSGAGVGKMLIKNYFLVGIKVEKWLTDKVFRKRGFQ